MDKKDGKIIWSSRTDGVRSGTYAEKALRTFAWTVALEHNHNSMKLVEVIIREVPSDCS